MHLTKVAITDKRVKADFYALHAFIYGLFPAQGKHIDRSDPVAAGILYRLERGYSTYALVQSRIAPLLGDTKEFTPTFTNGQRFWFRLRANVTYRRGSDKRRLAILDPDAQMAWLDRKAADAGFVLAQANIIDRPGIQYAARQGGEVAISPVTFEGELAVANAALFGRAVESGIGSGKGFGCGLLSLAKA